MAYRTAILWLAFVCVATAFYLSFPAVRSCGVGRGCGTAHPANLFQLSSNILDVTCEVAGDRFWFVGDVSYGVDEDIRAVIDRGVAAHGLPTRVISVHLDGELLLEDNWSGVIGKRHLVMMLKNDLSVLEVEAINGTLFRKVKALETKVDELMGQIETLVTANNINTGQIDTLTGQIDALVTANNIKTGQIDALVTANNINTGQIDTLAGQIETLMVDREERELDVTESKVENCLTDSISFFNLAEETWSAGDDPAKGKLKALSESRNSKTHFFRSGGRKVKHLSELLTYDPPQWENMDSRSVLCAKVWIVCKFLEKGLPKVRWPA